MRPLQSVCGHECAVLYGKVIREKKNRSESRVRKEKLKTRSDYMKEAQVAFNAFIRARDKNKPCICCDMPLQGSIVSTGGGYDAGHYRSVGSAPHMRFNEDNCHAQRKQCNRWGSGRAVDYRIGLIRRIGIERVDALESDQSVKKYTIDDLKQIKATYKAKLKELNSGEG